MKKGNTPTNRMQKNMVKNTKNEEEKYTKDGKEYPGVNVEDASTRAGTCAERAAISSAITAGVKKGEFKEIHVMTSSSTGIGMPCFVCRQMISELFDKDAKVICYNTSGESVMHTVEELCPYPFGEEDLK